MKSKALNILQFAFLILNAFVLFCAVSFILPGGNSVVTIANMSWNIAGLHFVIISIFSITFNFVVRRKFKKKIFITSIIISCLSLVFSLLIIGNIVKKTYDNGGNINFIKQLICLSFSYISLVFHLVVSKQYSLALSLHC